MRLMFSERSVGHVVLFMIYINESTEVLDEPEASRNEEEPADDDLALAWPQTEFSLPRLFSGN
ncbi:unnamed protein product [Enterobius vermicularis]|uniref:Uncharacterized protein n=1 Tax=Enterobius vermicularis TaxID=51028 RepID=A0A0N4UW96_ENTVE|nr:unnamed protein product [Enterobius vermicularis]